MTMRIQGSRPLEWPSSQERTKKPVRSKFGRWNSKPTAAGAIEDLSEELRLLKASGAVVISTDLPIRQDGLPYSSAREPEDPGVAVYFDLAGERQVIAIDQYDRVGCNLHAVARTINALRQIERDGGPSILRAAVSGFKALPERGSGTPWWEVIGCERSDSLQAITRLYRLRARDLHPDRGGDVDAWTELQEAYRQARDAKGQ